MLYADDVTLLAYEAIDQGHPCCTTTTKVWLTSGTVPWRPLVGADVYRHAGLEPPVAPTLDPKFSYAGFAVDILFALFTGGRAPSKFRGTESWSPVVSPGREGTGTPEQAGRFPRNHDADARVPVFIDEHGGRCAVAELLVRDGQSALANRIAAHMKNFYLREMIDDDLASWIRTSGLTLEELAWIQPSYSPHRLAISKSCGYARPMPCRRSV